MKRTIKNFCKFSSINPDLIRAVVRQSGGWQSFQDMAPDINNHGIAGGFSGWIYYTETCQFYAKNQSSIIKLVECQSDEYGYHSAQDMVKGFRSLDTTLSEIGYTLYGNKRQHDTQVANALAWFAAEEVANAYNDWVNYGE
jgi:hypothetical protein